MAVWTAVLVNFPPFHFHHQSVVCSPLDLSARLRFYSWMGRWQCCLNWSPDSSDPTKWFVQSLWIQRRDFSSGSVLKHWSIPIWKVSQVFGRCSATAAGLLQLRVVPVCVLVALGSSSGMYLHRLCHRKRMMGEGWGWSAGIWAWTCWMFLCAGALDEKVPHLKRGMLFWLPRLSITKIGGIGSLGVLGVSMFTDVHS